MVKKKFSHEIQIKTRLLEMDVIELEWTDMSTSEQIIRVVNLHSTPASQKSASELEDSEEQQHD